MDQNTWVQVNERTSTDFRKTNKCRFEENNDISCSFHHFWITYWYKGLNTILDQKFKDFSRTFQGPHFEIPRTTFMFMSKNLPMKIVWQYDCCSFSIMYMPGILCKGTGNHSQLHSSSRLYDMAWGADHFYWSFQRMKMGFKKNSRTFKNQEWIAGILEDF